MNNLVVPISVRFNTLTEDSITIGLLAFNGRNAYFDFSSEKLKMAKSFLDKNSLSYLEGALTSMGRSFLNNNGGIVDKKLLDEKYLKYLSNYSNGILKIGKPKGFALDLNEETFSNAFRAIVGSELGTKSKKVPTSLRNEMRSFLKNDAFKSVNVLYSINPILIPGIYAPHKLDFVGVNGSPYAGLAVDFTKDEVDVDKSILTFSNIAKGLAKRANEFGMKKGRYELFFNDPDTKENKKILDMVRKDDSKGFEMVEFEKITSVLNKLENGDYRKFSESELAGV